MEESELYETFSPEDRRETGRLVRWAPRRRTPLLPEASRGDSQDVLWAPQERSKMVHQDP